MKTFEERYTAWVDGMLQGPELEAFEKELNEHPEGESDRKEVHALGRLLRTYGKAPALANADFFEHQLMARIAAEQPVPERIKQPSLSAWPWLRLVWATAFSLVLGWMLSKSFYSPVQKPSAPPQFAYQAQILAAHAGDSEISATVVHDAEDDVTVLWLDGLDYLPASYELQ